MLLLTLNHVDTVLFLTFAYLDVACSCLAIAMIEISMMASVDVIQHWLCHELLTCDTCVHLHVLLT